MRIYRFSEAEESKQGPKMISLHRNLTIRDLILELVLGVVQSKIQSHFNDKKKRGDGEGGGKVLNLVGLMRVWSHPTVPPRIGSC